MAAQPPLSRLSPVPSSPTRPRPARTGLGAWQPLLWTVLAVASAWAVGNALQLDAGSELGYWIGVVGGVAMLLLFLYPLRKRVPLLRGLGATKHWFVFHMLMGAAGPWLILVHCNFRVGSTNAAVALGSMLVVAASGVVGRYLYVHVHRGLDGRRADLAELRARLDASHDKLGAAFSLAPQVRDRLLAFEAAVVGAAPAAAPVLLWRSHRAAQQARREVRGLIDQALADAPGQLAPERRRQVRAHWRRQAAQHIAQSLGVAQLGAWERLFALWHVLHLPFVYVMVACAVAHVIAVHAY